MKKVIIVLVLFLTISKLGLGQVNILPSIGYSYTNDNKIHGVFLRNEVVFGKKKNYFDIGFEAQFFQGNRNFGEHESENYNVEHKGYSPQYLFLNGATLQYEYPIEMEAKGARTFQISLSFGYKRKFEVLKKDLFIEGGIYTSYVNKFYLVGPYNDMDVLMSIGDGTSYEATIDLYLPSNHRYIAFGPYVGFSYFPFDKIKTPIGFNTKFYYLSNKSSWFNIGISILLRPAFEQ